MNRSNNILIVNTFGIGDVLFSTPLIRQVRENLPASKIYYICNRRNYDLLKNDPELTDVLIYEKDEFREAYEKSKIGFIKKLIHFIRAVKKLHIDSAIDLSLNHQMSVILMLAGIRARVGFNYKNRGRLLTKKIDIAGFKDKHVVEYYLDLLRFLGFRVSGGNKLRAYSSPGARLKVDSFMKERALDGKTIVGMVGGGGKSWGGDAAYRRWDSANFAYLAKSLIGLGDIAVLLFGTSEESDICNSICRDSGQNNCFSLCGNTTLDELVEFMKRCSLVICNEGGSMHIAVSQGVKTISIFGPVDDKVYGPYPVSDIHKVIKAHDLECRPCYKNFKHDKCDNHDCLKRIDKDEVLREAIGILGFGKCAVT